MIVILDALYMWVDLMTKLIIRHNKFSVGELAELKRLRQQIFLRIENYKHNKEG